MSFIYKVMKLFIYFMAYGTFCQSYPLEYANDIYTAESTEPASAYQTEISDDLVLQSQADASADSGLKLALFKPAETARESVKLETEGVPSKILSLYDTTQKKYLDNTQPRPLLDTISEHEKYGNSGDMFDGFSRGLVNGYEAFANFLNSLITKPKEIARSISKGITTRLDVLGGKLVGLQ